MTTETPTKIGPTLDDLKAFYKAADDAMDSIVILRKMTTSTDAESVWDTVSALINVISVDQTDGHPCYDQYVDLEEAHR